MKYKRSVDHLKGKKRKKKEESVKLKKDKYGLNAIDYIQVTKFIESGFVSTRAALLMNVTTKYVYEWKKRPEIRAAISRRIAEITDQSRMKYQVLTDETLTLGLIELRALEKYTTDKNKYDKHFEQTGEIHEDVVACMRRRKGDIPEVYTPNYAKSVDQISKIYSKSASFNINIENKDSSSSPVVVIPERTQMQDVGKLLEAHKQDLQNEFASDGSSVEIKDAINVTADKPEPKPE